jgi:hypothetical protein
LNATTLNQDLPHFDPQRRAWGILLLSFAAFCTICVISGVALVYYLFQSTVPLDALMRVGRGTGAVSGQAVRMEKFLSAGDVLTTDAQSQVSVFFDEGSSHDHLVTSITLHASTSLNVRRALRPRFDWATVAYGIDIQDFEGELDVLVPADLGRDFRLTLRTKQGDLIDLSASGEYSISASDSQMQIINHSGMASLIPLGASTGRLIPAGKAGQLVFGSPEQGVVVTDSPVDLLGDVGFANVSNTLAPESDSAASWACQNTQSEPQGQFLAETKDGRVALRLVRGDSATTNAETRCLRYFGQDGIDVSAYDQLELRVSFEIVYQSLSVCGVEASECPLMLRLDYADEYGARRIWFHGFYYNVQSELAYPFQCNSCAQEHEIVNEKAWYTYESGNLFSLIPPDKRPKSIINVQFYASGHQYDVYIGEIAMLARGASLQ